MLGPDEDEGGFVEYFIYLKEGYEDDVDTLLNGIHLSLFPRLKDYIWHLETFNLCLRKEANGSTYFHGRICFGDAITDEWFLFSLLMELSKAYPDFVIRVIDHDGEFPLIEAADVLPSWAGSPEVTEGRVYIHQGSLHLIPIATHPSQLTPFPAGPISSIDQAANVVQSQDFVTCAHDKVQTVLKKKILAALSDEKTIYHHKTLTIPTKLASVLQSRPDLIAPAIHAFVNRDSMDYRALHSRKHFQLDQIVKYRVKFTRLLYAMLDSQKFHPDKKSKIKEAEDSLDLLGLKLTSAFEILASRCNQRTKKQESASPNLCRKYQRFEKSLEESGYFRDLLPASKEHNLLKDKCMIFFRESVDSQESRYSKNLMDLLNKESEPLLGNSEDLKDDGESWLHIDEGSFEELLTKHFSTSVGQPDNDVRIPSELNTFLSKMSSFEGIDFRDGAEDFDPEALDSQLKDMQQTTESSDEDEPAEMSEYFEALEEELFSSKVEPIREKRNVSSKEELEAQLKEPVDIDFTVFNNLLKSYKNETSGGGPASSLLKSVKIDNARSG